MDREEQIALWIGILNEKVFAGYLGSKADNVLVRDMEQMGQAFVNQAVQLGDWVEDLSAPQLPPLGLVFGFGGGLGRIQVIVDWNRCSRFFIVLPRELPPGCVPFQFNAMMDEEE